jgi:hypothetical protein
MPCGWRAHRNGDARTLQLRTSQPPPPPPLPPPTHIRRQETGTRNPFHFHFHRGFDFKDKDRGQDPVSPQAAGRPLSVLFCVLCPV